jgi:hypothetical protein
MARPARLCTTYRQAKADIKTIKVSFRSPAYSESVHILEFMKEKDHDKTNRRESYICQRQCRDPYQHRHCQHLLDKVNNLSGPCFWSGFSLLDSNRVDN